MPTNVNIDKSSLEGKIAVVTGSTQGLGEAIVRLFIERGIQGIVVVGRNKSRGEALVAELTARSSTGGSRKLEVVFVQADLANIDDVRRIMRTVDERFGKLHVLVNSAALTARSSIWDETPEQYDRMMAINTKAPFFLMQDAVRIMEREKIEGSIVNISSTASYGGMPMIASYSVSKAALNAATKSFAYSVAWSRIRVNALAIGWMDTPGEDDVQRRLHTNNQDWLEDAERSQPFGRLLKTDEVARCVAFCASEESGMMTGAVLDFDQSVWGAGPQPVPPPKDQWAKAKGMEFSFPAPSSPNDGKGSSN